MNIVKLGAMIKRAWIIQVFILFHCTSYATLPLAKTNCLDSLGPSADQSFREFLQQWNVDPAVITSGQLEPTYPKVKLLKGSAAQIASRKWVNQQVLERGHQGRLLFSGSVAPELPDVSIYHWGNGNSIHYPDQGVPVEQLRFWTKKSGNIELGLYAASHPLSSAMYGQVLLEVVLYSESYPITQPDSPLQVHSVPAHFFARDILGETYDDTDGISKHYGLTHNYFYVYDFSVVKEIKWPAKDLIVGIWDRLEVESVPEILVQYMTRIGLQWSITPNFSRQERASLFRGNVEKFFSLSRFFLPDYQLGYKQADKFIDAENLFRNGILKTVLDTDEQLIDLNTGRFNLHLMLQAYTALSQEARTAFDLFLEVAAYENHEMILILKMIPKLGNSESFEEVFSGLADYYALYREGRSGYTFFNSRLMDAEVEIVKD